MPILLEPLLLGIRLALVHKKASHLGVQVVEADSLGRLEGIMVGVLVEDGKGEREGRSCIAKGVFSPQANEGGRG